MTPLRLSGYERMRADPCRRSGYGAGRTPGFFEFDRTGFGGLSAKRRRSADEATVFDNCWNNSSEPGVMSLSTGKTYKESTRCGTLRKSQLSSLSLALLRAKAAILSAAHLVALVDTRLTALWAVTAQSVQRRVSLLASLVTTLRLAFAADLTAGAERGPVRAGKATRKAIGAIRSGGFFFCDAAGAPAGQDMH